ncbi:DUF2066 domain-containing protein [Magnetospirillum sulfuroxidans]|uniref:DUF2066 domain-containing protein n=1 Tax=Magnetospirillum sulfuroxidans TaxID=611300 RepID=A0ABS5IDF2_9PROT|nr:DUF2066 domain-containing protein [Magnetospirillum sulfuroxidans]MBR9972207.1 DUF2066 domain-containing protein [Magnetospirillum sulfuroxidans]
MPSLRLAGAMALVAALLVFFNSPDSRAQVSFDPFTVDGVEVDVSAANAQVAKDQAIVAAQRQGFATLLERLTAPEDRARLPKADGVEFVRDFSVEQERSLASRYIASLSVRYNGSAVKRLLQAAGIAVTEARTRPVVVVPVFVPEDGRAALWDDPNPWRNAWGNLHGGGLVPLLLPLGDLGDIQAITAAQALAGDALAMQSLGARWRTPDVLVAAATLRGKVLDVALHAGPTTPKPFEALSYRQNDGESLDALLSRAVKDIARAIETTHKQNAAHGGESGTVSALVPLSGMPQWLAVRERLGRVPQVKSWELVSLSRTEAAIIMHVVGDSNQLAEGMSTGGLSLKWADSFWTVQPVGVN